MRASSITINSPATLRISNTNALGAGLVSLSGTLDSTGVISIDDGGQDLILAGNIDSSNSGGFIKNGAGVMTISGNNAYTGNTAYANQAVNFLNAWASTNTTLTRNADRFLASGLYAYTWAAAAEIMHTYSGWAAADVTTFQNYLLNVYYPLQHSFLTVHNGAYDTNYWANWDLAVFGMHGMKTRLDFT
jgi:autotransporter-associated beta strand protein